MPTIRFENTEEKYKKTAGDLLKSLNLDPERWLEDQEFELTPQTQAKLPTMDPAKRLPVDRVFCMELPAPAKLTGSDHWLCRMVEQDGSHRLYVGDYLWAAEVAAGADPEVAVAALPVEILAISLLNLSLHNMGFLTRLTQLTSLDLEGCRGLSDLSPLSELAQLTNLNLNKCASLTSIKALKNLRRLRVLNLNWCERLNDIQALEELTQLKRLNLGKCYSVTDLRALAKLAQLESLNLSDKSNLTDVSALSGLSQLTSLNLGGCSSLTDLAPLSSLQSLTSLNLRGCRSLSNLSPLSGLKRLTSLDLIHCRSLINLEGLSELVQLTRLYLNYCESLSDLTAVAGLTQLTSLDLTDCRSLTDISAISGLTQLTNLNLSGCKSLTNLGHMSGMTKLTSLNMNSCSSLEDFSPLSRLTSLTSLRLIRCVFLTDLYSLSGLTKLTSLDLMDCRSLTDLAPLSMLLQLTSLSLCGCEGIRSLNALSTCHHLDTLILSGCTRLTSIEPVREIAVLRKLTGFNPDQAAELLAHTAVLRKDGAYIDEHASAWLQQIQQMDEAAPEERERFATTLGEALSLLGESPHEETYEAYLASRPEFSASPWKAWFSGTRELSGWELMRVRVERQQLAEANPGCIGGVCASFLGERGDEEVSGDERQWALDWLGRMEQAWADRGNELLPVAAEVCVAHLRHGLDDALERWLLRLTDESDPASLDPVHAALGRWQLERGNLNAARNHAGAIETPERRDPLLAELAKHYVANEPKTAGDLLLTISALPMRREIMELLCADTSFVADPLNVERLVVACGDSAEALAGLIGKLPSETDPKLLEKLSTAVREGSRDFHALHRSTLERMLEELDED